MKSPTQRVIEEIHNYVWQSRNGELKGADAAAQAILEVVPLKPTEAMSRPGRQEPCPRPGQCRWRPRYDTAPPKIEMTSDDPEDLVRAIKAMTKKVYVRDVCERCGRIEERGQ